MFDAGILVPIVLFICCVWIIDRVIDRRALNRERLKMIEKNGNVKDLNLNTDDKKSQKFYALKYGLVAIGVSLGVLAGAIIEQNNWMPHRETGYFFCIFLFVGLALVLTHYIVRKELNKSNQG